MTVWRLGHGLKPFGSASTKTPLGDGYGRTETLRAQFAEINAYPALVGGVRAPDRFVSSSMASNVRPPTVRISAQPLAAVEPAVTRV